MCSASIGPGSSGSIGSSTVRGSGARLGLIVHHTDAEREYAYDRQSHFGKLDKALDAAAVNNWAVADMKKDWKRVFAFQ